MSQTFAFLYGQIVETSQDVDFKAVSEEETGGFVLRRNAAGYRHFVGEFLVPSGSEEGVHGVLDSVRHGVRTFPCALIYLYHGGMNYLPVPTKLGNVHIEIQQNTPVLEVSAGPEALALLSLCLHSPRHVAPHVFSERFRGVAHRVHDESGLPAACDADDGGSTPVVVEVTFAQLCGDVASHHKVVVLSVETKVVESALNRAHLNLDPLARV